MPGEADRLKKENEELRREVGLLDSYNTNLERRLKEANEKVQTLSSWWGSLGGGNYQVPFPHAYVDPERKAWDKLQARVAKLESDLQDLARREDQRAEALRVQRLGYMGRLDELAAAYDAWDLMRDTHTSRLSVIEAAQADLFALLGRLDKKGRRWWQR